MVDEVILSPEEQDERAKQWLKDNGPAIVIGVLLGLGAIFGYNQYLDRQKRNAENASQLYDQALSTIQRSSIADIQSMVDTLKADHANSAYAHKAALLRARQLSVSDMPAALVELQWVSDHARESGVLHAAQIRQAKILLAQGELDAAKTIAETKTIQWFLDSYYHEILGDIALKQQSAAEARAHYQSAIDSLGSSESAYSSILTLKMNRLHN